MSLVFSGGTIVDNTFNLGTTAKKKAFYDGIKAALTSAGWTVTTALPTQIYTTDNSSGNPSNNDTITMLGKTYTWKTAINDSNDGEVLIGATGVDSFTNLVSAVNLTAGAGTTYSSATTAGDGTITAQSLAGTAADTITYTANSEDDAGGAVSDSMAWGSWNASTLSAGGFDAETAETPDYLTARIGFTYNGEGNDTPMVLYNRDKSTSENFFRTGFFTYTDNADQRIIASKYGFWSFKPGSKSDFTSLMAQVLSIPAPMRCKKITNATNASPIAITTNVAHGYTTGQQVKQLYVEGNTAANGTFTITVVDPTTYTLNGSAGNGAFTGTRGVVGNVTSGYQEVFEFAWTNSAVRSGGGPQFRESVNPQQATPTMFNGTAYTEFVNVVNPFKTVQRDDAAEWPWFNDARFFEAPIMGISQDGGTTWKAAGQVYNAALLQQNTPMDQPITDESANDWLTLTDSSSSGTWMILV
jgi:hypothetical protein